uniref:Uncharacterized protein n=1 Tax=Anguilla anguilla TaxID=7936 RepID=A0A0E9XK47_ANGAN
MVVLKLIRSNEKLLSSLDFVHPTLSLQLFVLHIDFCPIYEQGHIHTRFTKGECVDQCHD